MNFTISTSTSNRILSKAIRSRNKWLIQLEDMIQSHEFKEPLYKNFLSLICDLAEDKDISSKELEYFEVTVPLGEIDSTLLNEKGYLEEILITKVYEIVKTFPFCEQEDIHWIDKTLKSWAEDIRSS